LIKRTFCRGQTRVVYMATRGISIKEKALE
jgi:hypothetical protein